MIIKHFPMITWINLFACTFGVCIIFDWTPSPFNRIALFMLSIGIGRNFMEGIFGRI